ncbi:MAG: DNA repair protein RadC [Rhodothalassiaceae bacterium]
MADPTEHVQGHRDRLRRRVLTAGPETLADYELLEFLLCLAVPRRDVKPLAKQLIKHFGSFAAALTAEPARLREVDGVGDGVVPAFLAIRAAGTKLLQAHVLDQPVLSSWQALLDYCRAAMAHEPVEQFRLLFLDRKNRLIADEVQQTGTVDHTPVYPREVMKRALQLNASAIILVHNHPSGDPTPSRADIAMTQEIVEAARRLNIAVHDHLIIARNQSTSFKAVGLL